MVQWLGLHDPTAGVTGSNLGRGTKIPQTATQPPLLNKTVQYKNNKNLVEFSPLLAMEYVKAYRT